MATLDYAVLAEYARVDASGLITIVGGGFDRVVVGPAGGGQQVFVALRVLFAVDEEQVPFEVKVRAPNDEYEIGFSGSASRSPEAEPTAGLYSFTAAVGLGVPLPVAGLYVVHVILSGDIVRALPFVVSMAQPPQV